MSRSHLAAILASVVLLAAPAVAAGDPFLPFADGAASPAIGDGERFAAFMSDPRTVHVMDRGFESDVPVPSSCADPVVLEDVGGGQALVNCGDRGVVGAEGDPLLLDLVTGAWHEPPGARRLLHQIRSGDESASFSEVGEHWLGGEANGYHSYGALWLAWRTGVFEDDEGDAGQMPDLDAPGLFVPLCRPLVRATEHEYDQTGDGPRFVRFPYEPPFAYVGLAVRRCGSRRRTLIDMAGHGVQVGGGLVTWLRDDTVRAYAPYCGVRFSQPLEEIPFAVAHSYGRLYASMLQADGRFRILRTSEPWCTGLTSARAVRVESQGRGRAAALADWSAPASDWAMKHLPIRVHRPRSLPLRPGAEAVVRTSCLSTSSVRWRIGTDGWRDAKRTRTGGWRFRAPAFRAPARLSLYVSCYLGERGKFFLPLS
jgi:hypothetical protein